MCVSTGIVVSVVCVSTAIVVSVVCVSVCQLRLCSQLCVCVNWDC